MSIASRFDSCVEFFLLVCNALQHVEPRLSTQLPLVDIQSDFGRLRVWAGNLGAHRTGKSSLDHRLREAEHMRQTTTTLLDDLRDNLRDGLSILRNERLPYDEQSSDSDTSDSSFETTDICSPKELEAILASIKQIVSLLYKLATALRDPLLLDRFRRGKNVETSHFEDWDVNHVRDKFPPLATNSPFLLQRLGRANTGRRRVFKYKASHNEKLKSGINLSAPPAEPVVLVARQGCQEQEEGTRSGDFQIQDEAFHDSCGEASDRAITIDTKITDTTVATFVEDRTLGFELDKADEVSETSSAASEGTVDERAIKIPDAPPGAFEASEFVCPYCFQMIRAPNTMRWRKHVFEDLQPYLCTFEHCLDANKTYESRHAWFDHEASTHRMQWTCLQCRKDCSSKKDFIDHVQQHHPSSFTDQQLPAVMDMSMKPADDRITGKCLFCNKEDQTLRIHLARHMRDLALFTLPRVDDNDKNDENSNLGQAGASGSESSGSAHKETLSDSDVMSEISEDAKKEVIDEDENNGSTDLDMVLRRVQDNHISSYVTKNEWVNELWDAAYLKLCETEQWRAYEGFLLKDIEDLAQVDFSKNRMQREAWMKAFILQKAEILEEAIWDSKITGSGAREIVRHVLHIHDILSSNEVGVLHSTLAWAAVLILLPPISTNQLLNSEGNEDLFDEARIEDTLEILCILISRIDITQRLYLGRHSSLALVPEDPRDHSFETEMTDLCVQILDCEARAVSSLLVTKTPVDKSPVPGLLADLKKAEIDSHNMLRMVESEEFKISLKQQNHRMDELLRAQIARWQGQKQKKKISEHEENTTFLRRQKLYFDDCLSALRTSSYENSKDQIPDRVTGTCQWVLQNQSYQDWEEARSSNILWICAGPGYGKTVLAKSLVDHELCSMTGLTTCYYFFRQDDPDNRSVVTALTALLHQLCSQNQALLEQAHKAYQMNGGKMTYSFSWHWNLLMSLAEHEDAGRIIFILDAVDECEEVGRNHFIASLYNLCADPKSHGNIAFLVTSRSFPATDKQLRLKMLELSGDDCLESLNQEVDLVANHHLRRIQTKRGLNAELLDSLRLALRSVPVRTQLWLYLVLAAVEKVLDVRTMSLADFIGLLPKDVDDAYGALLKLYPKQNIAHTIIGMTVAARRPLTLSEINQALGIIERPHSPVAAKLMPDVDLQGHLDDLLTHVVRVDEGGSYFRHQTVKDWWSKLEGPRSIEHVDSLLARICLTYLSLEIFDDKPPASDWKEKGALTSAYVKYEVRRRETFHFAKDYDMLIYAAVYWPSHYNAAESHEGTPIDLQDRWKYVCQPSSHCFQTWFSVYWYGNNMRNDFDSEWWKIPAFSPVALAAFLGGLRMVQTLIEQGESVDTKGDKSVPPLLVAINRNDIAMVQVLVEAGVLIDSQTVEKWTPVSLAAAKGLEEVTTYLLAHGADVEQKTFPLGMTPMIEAAQAGHLSITELLLQKNAGVNTTSNKGLTPLMAAAEAGHESIAMALLDAGAAIRALSYSHQTALHFATSGGYDALAQSLLAKGALPDTKDGDGRSPLSWAAQRGLLRTTELLIELGSDIHSEDENGLTPLFHAIQSGHDMVIEQLLEAGEYVNASDKDGQSALWYALQLKDQRTTQVLMHGGADPNLADGDGRTLLMQMLLHLNHLVTPEIVHCLYDRGADIDTVDQKGRTTLSYAAELSSASVVRALLDTNADPNVVDQEGRSPLHHVLVRSSGWITEIVEVLVEAKTNLHQRDHVGHTPYDLARKMKHTAALNLIERAIFVG